MSTAAFDTLYAKLNAAQKQAVDAIEGPVMVIAGPGTGKTTILTLRIANILRTTDTPANGILAITYTDAGVKAMRAKLQGVIGQRAHDVQIHTFHSFAAAMIAEYPDHFLQIHEMKVMTDIEQETLIRDIIADEKFGPVRPISKPDHYVPGIIKSIEESKRQAMTPEMVRQHIDREIKRVQDDPESISTRGATKGQLKADAREQIEKCERTRLFADAYELYEERKRAAKKLDFSDLIVELLVALRRDELFLRLVQERFLYIHVDEHQDTNDTQNFIVALIAEFFETPNIFMVGDEKQAIYRFQGASVENFLFARKKWPAMKLISLDTNYRSHQGILDASFGMIENNYEPGEHEDLRVKLRSGRGKVAKAEKSVEVVTGENVAAAEARMIADLRRIASDIPDATVAIIVRRNRDLDRVIRLCETSGVKISSERSVDIFNHPVGSLYFDLIQYLADPSRIDALARTVIAGMWGLSFGEASEIVRSVKSGQADKELFESRLPGLLHIQRQMLNDSPVGFLVHAAEKSGYASLFMRDPVYISVWRGIVALAESIVRDARIQDPMKLMEALLAYRLSAESRMVKVTVGAPGASFQALTAHGSKGLEFDYVFIPYATDEAWIGKPRGSSFVLPRRESSQNDVHDVRRLFYVALTRAREKATVLTALEESDGKQLTPLRFIAELDGAHIASSTVPRAEAAAVLSSVATDHEREGSAAAHSIRDRQVVDIAQRVLLEKGLSVTALNHFLKCPNTFLYQSILRVPQAPSVSADKGTAMHEAISSVWRSDIFSIADDRERASRIQVILADALEEYFKTSFLPLSDKEAVRKELLAAVPNVADALEPHFMLKGEKDAIYAEHWVKTSFIGAYAGAQITIPLHGKLDAILDRSDEVSVFDYKTKQAMSVNAIKGETKSSDGGYFRQLIFYKLLMSEEPKWRMKRISPALVFVSPDEKGRCPTISIPIGTEDVERVKKEIQSLIDAVWSGSILGARCDDEKCEWCGLAGI